MNSKTDSDSNQPDTYSENALPLTTSRKHQSRIDHFRDPKHRNRELKSDKDILSA